MDNPATPQDLVKRGHNPSEGDVVEQTRLDEAWRALQAEVPSLAARLDRDEVHAAFVVDVLCAAALRVLRNPEGFRSGGGGVDDYQENWQLADATLDLYFTSAELRRLAPPAYPSAGSVQYR